MSDKPIYLEIKNEVLLLGSMVEEAVINSAQALKDNDLHCSDQVVLNDVHINRKRYEIEVSIIVMMAIQQPVAHDLRLLAVCLNICSELERMADYAKEIANINIRSNGLSMPNILRDIYSMAEKAVDMLHRAMTTFADEDVPAARNIMLEDDVIDGCYGELYYQAINNVLGNPGNIDRVNYVIWVAHNLERLGDRVTNICERVIYAATGEHPQANPILKEFRLSPQEN